MKSLVMTGIIFTLLSSLTNLRSSEFSGKKNLIDTLYIKIANGFDSSNLKYSQPNITRIILNKFNYAGFDAAGEVSFDIQRRFDFKIPVKENPRFLHQGIIGANALSDSLRNSNRNFFKRHTFYVILTRQDTCYFYSAKGEYMYKNFNNDTGYDSAKDKRHS